MKIIKPFVELIDDINPADILAKIERCGRVSHQSESKGNPENFIRKIIKLGHESVLEHVSLTFHIICDRAIQNELVRHRHASFTVESTRYVQYDELEVVEPPFFNTRADLSSGERRATATTILKPSWMRLSAFVTSTTGKLQSFPAEKFSAHPTSALNWRKLKMWKIDKDGNAIRGFKSC